MIKLQKFDNDTSKTLLNERGRLSFCRCCCDVNFSTLYLHIIPQFGTQDCEDQDEGTDTTAVDAYPMTIALADNHCWDWRTATRENSEGTITCWEEGGGFSPVNTSVGVQAWLYCMPTDTFRLDLCWGASGHPPALGSGSPPQCTLYQIGLAPTAYNTCNAQPGEFWLDFGNIIPMTGTSSACECPFHVYIDQNPIYFDPNHLYWYPAESGFAFDEPFHSMLWSHEWEPSIGTWLHPLSPHGRPPFHRTWWGQMDIPADIAELFQWEDR